MKIKINGVIVKTTTDNITVEEAKEFFPNEELTLLKQTDDTIVFAKNESIKSVYNRILSQHKAKHKGYSIVSLYLPTNVINNFEQLNAVDFLSQYDLNSVAVFNDRILFIKFIDYPEEIDINVIPSLIIDIYDFIGEKVDIGVTSVFATGYDVPRFILASQRDSVNNGESVENNFLISKSNELQVGSLENVRIAYRG